MKRSSRWAATACTAALLLPTAMVAQAPTPSYVPHRVILTKKQRVEDFEAMAAELAQADVVFFGEQHDDPATHRMQLALLEAIGRRRDQVVLSLEMFERDVQPQVTAYAAGQLGEEEFLAGSRPWPRYATDYRGLVELAKARGWPVIAANVPRPMASAVSRAGLAYLETIPADRRAHAASQLSCPENDDYAKRFLATMEGMPTNHGGGPEDPEAARQTLLRIYQAQCVKDETMAESIAAAWSPGTLVVHMNGAFHSDFHLGTVSRVKSRLPKGSRIAVVTGMPVADLDAVDRKAEKKRGDWLVYVLKPTPPAP